MVELKPQSGHAWKITAKQFEIWLANLDPRFGTEAGITRPVLVVQTDLLNMLHPSTLICPITGNVVAESQIRRVNIKKGVANKAKLNTKL